MKRRIVSMLLCMSMAASVLAGCGGDSNGNDVESTEEWRDFEVEVKFNKKVKDSILTNIVVGKSTASDVKAYLREKACTYDTNKYGYPDWCTNTDYFLGHEAQFRNFCYIENTDIVYGYSVRVAFKDVDDYKSGITEIRDYFDTMSVGVSGYNDGSMDEPIKSYLIADEEDYYIFVSPWITTYEETDAAYYNTYLTFGYVYVDKDNGAGIGVEWKDEDGKDYVPKLERKIAAIESKWEELQEASVEPYTFLNVSSADIKGKTLTCESVDGYDYIFDIKFSRDLTEVTKLEFKEKIDKFSEDERWNYTMEHEVVSAYRDYIKDNFGGIEDYFDYSFIYANEDEIPDLLIQTGGASTDLLIYKDGTVINSNFGARYGNLMYKEYGNYVISTYSYDWFVDKGSYNLVDGNAVLVHWCEIDSKEDIYTIDDVVCSEEEYNSYFDDSDLKYGFENASSTIKGAFENIKRVPERTESVDSTEF